MIRKNTSGDISDAEFEAILKPFIDDYDDFVISYFTTGNDFQTLPLLIYSMTKKEVKPDIYALSTLMIVVVTVLMVMSNLSSKDKTADRKAGIK